MPHNKEHAVPQKLRVRVEKAFHKSADFSVCLFGERQGHQRMHNSHGCHHIPNGGLLSCQREPSGFVLSVKERCVEAAVRRKYQEHGGAGHEAAELPLVGIVFYESGESKAYKETNSAPDGRVIFRF